MPKESRGGRRGTGGPAYSSGELELPDGSEIEFDGKLQYGKDDSAMTGKVRQVIEAFEDKRVKNKVEYAYATDKDGNPIIQEIRGSRNSVRVPLTAHTTPDSTFTHIHPRGDGMLGGTFSQQDLRNFANFDNKTMRARAKEGAYSISKTSKFDKAGFMGYVRKVDGEFEKNYKEKAKSLGKQLESGKITWSEYAKGNAKAFNTSLVQLHNDYLKGQKQYGYTYTLETVKGAKKK